MSDEVQLKGDTGENYVKDLANGSEGSDLRIENGAPAWVKRASALFGRTFAGGSVSLNDPFSFANNVIKADPTGKITKLSNTQIQLKGGYSYVLEGGLNGTATGSLGYVNHQFYNVTDGAYDGVDGTIILATNAGNSGSTTQAKMIIDAAVDTVIELRNQAGDGVNQWAATVEVVEL